MNMCSWPIDDDRSLEFTIFDPSHVTWYDVPGLYIFAYHVGGGQWKALYVGKADSFSDRLPSHERWNEAVRHGATHVHALEVPQEAIRDNWERKLIHYLQPKMNVQFR